MLLFSSDDDSLEGNPFLDVATPEQSRELQNLSASSGEASIYANHTPEFGTFAPNGVGGSRRNLDCRQERRGNGVYGAGGVRLFTGNGQHQQLTAFPNLDQGPAILPASLLEYSAALCCAAPLHSVPVAA